MKTKYYNYKQCATLLMLLVWLPLKGLAQTDLFDMVVEKTDGTELVFRISDDYPTLQYLYGGEEKENTIVIQMAIGYKSVPCSKIKRFYTRKAKIVPGDANFDGMVDATDIVEVVNYIMGVQSDRFNEKTADVNNDGTVNTADIEKIVNIITGN